MKGLCKRLISFMLAVCMMVSMVPLGFAAEEQEANNAVSTISGNVKRIAGDDRIATSLGIATQLKDTLNVDKFETVVVASALNFPDALTGSYLAAKENAPILLTYEAANAKVQTYIENNLKDGGTVYILGGSTAVSTGFEDDLSAKGINVVRLAGSDRFGTNLAILQKAGITSGQEVLICTATGFADSLSASAAGLPILLVHNSLRADQKDYLASIFGAEGNYTIIGGEAAVSADIEQELAAMGTVKRLGGSSRYETSVLVAENFFGTTPGGAVLAYARNFPDGLCAGPLAYAMNAPLILTDNYDPREADEYVVGTNRGFVVGGPSLISDVATRAIFDLGSGTGVASYTVTFESNGGSAVQAQIVDAGGTVTKPADPTRAGCRFQGWYSDAALEVPYDFSTPVNDDITLYAAWIVNTVEERTSFYATFLPNDGSSNAYYTATVPAGQTLAEPNAPSREGYTFGGWYLDPRGVDAYDFSATVSCDLVLYAHWISGDPNSGNIHVESTGGGTIYSILSITVGDGEVVTTINADSTAILHVEFISQEDATVFADYAIQTPSYCEGVPVSIPIDCELPEYFLVRATLVDYDSQELCNPYMCIKYTQQYEEFENKTAEDYESEGERVLHFSTQDITTNFGVLADNVVEVPTEGAVNLISMAIVENENSTSDDISWSEIYTVHNPDEKILTAEIGTTILGYDENGQSFLFKIGSMTLDENGNAVITPDEDVDLSDFYKALKVDMNIIYTEPELDGEEGSDTTTGAGGTAPALDAEIIDVSVSPSVALGGNITWEPVDDLEIRGSLTGTGTMELEMKYDAHLFGDDYFECSAIQDTTVTLVIEVVYSTDDVGDDAEELGEKLIDEYDLPDIPIPTPIAGLVGYFKVSFPVEWELSAGLNFTATFQNRSGFKYDTNNGEQKVDEKSRTVDFGLKGSATLKMGPKISLGLKYLTSVVDISISVWAGVKVEGNAFLGVEGTDGPEKHACALCIDGTIKWFVEVPVTLQICIIEDVLDATPLDLVLFSLEGWINILSRFPGQFYFSVINSEDSCFHGEMHLGGGDCPNKKYRVDVFSEDANGNGTTGVAVTVKKNNGELVKTDDTSFALYLYDGVYSASATIDRRAVKKSFVVSKNPTTVTLSPGAADGKLNGKLLDADTNSPVSGASIVISSGDLDFASCTSNGSGTYTAHVPAGTYKVTITKNGYVPFETYVTVTEGATEYLETALMVNDEGQYMGGFSGRITNAVNGNPIAGVTLKIRSGWDNSTEGDVLQTLTTDSNGNFAYNTWTVFGVVIGMKAGNYTATASKDGYVTTSFNLVVLPGETKGGQNATMSPAMENQTYRIVLTWGSSPSDLDSHFNAVTTSGYRDHIYYSDKTGTGGNLDVDDTSSYGPETITVTGFDSLQNGFTYSVHDFSNRSSTSSTALSASGASVALYYGSELLKTYHVPTGRGGTVWNVFSVDGNGRVTDLNTFTYESNASNVGASFATAAVDLTQTMNVASDTKDYATY